MKISGTNQKSTGFTQNKTIKTFIEQRQLWLIALPGILWYAIFAYGPMGGLLMAFENYSLTKMTYPGPYGTRPL